METSYEDVESVLVFLSVKDCDCGNKGDACPEEHDRNCLYRLSFNATIYKERN